MIILHTIYYKINIFKLKKKLILIITKFVNCELKLYK